MKHFFMVALALLLTVSGARSQDFPILLKDTTKNVTTRSTATLTKTGNLKVSAAESTGPLVAPVLSGPVGSTFSIGPALGEDMLVVDGFGNTIILVVPGSPGAAQFPYFRSIPNSIPPTATSTGAGSFWFTSATPPGVFAANTLHTFDGTIWTPSGGGGGGAGASFNVDTFSASALQTVFALSQNPATESDRLFMMTVNTRVFEETTDYTVVGNTLTWLDTPFALDAGDTVQAYYQTGSTGGVAGGGTLSALTGKTFVPDRRLLVDTGSLAAAVSSFTSVSPIPVGATHVMISGLLRIREDGSGSTFAIQLEAAGTPFAGSSGIPEDVLARGGTVTPSVLDQRTFSGNAVIVPIDLVSDIIHYFVGPTTGALGGTDDFQAELILHGFLINDVVGGGMNFFREENFTATPAQTVFGLSLLAQGAPDGLNAVTVNGLKYNRGTSYTVSGNTLTWLDVPFALIGGDLLSVNYQRQ